MTDACPTTTRQVAERAARQLRRLDSCAGVDVLDPNEGVRNEWTLEATFTVEYLSPPAVQILADQDCGIVSTTLRAPGALNVVATV